MIVLMMSWWTVFNLCNYNATTAANPEVCWRAKYDELLAELQQQAEIIKALEAALYEVSQVNPSPTETRFYHGLTASEVKAQLENDSCFINFMGENIPYWRPNWTGFTDDDSIQIDSSDIIISVSTSWGNFFALLSYRVHGGAICWNIDAYKHLWREFRLWEAPVPRHLTDLEYVTIGFAYYCRELDPNVELLPEALKHHWENINGKNLWAEFIPLMRCRTGKIFL